MGRRLISSGTKFEELAGYSRAVVEGDWILLAGTSGHDHKADTLAEGVVEQTRQSLANIRDGLEQAGATMKDVVRIRVFVANRADVMAVSGVLKETFDKIRPANTTIVCTMASEHMKVELEVTAFRRQD